MKLILKVKGIMSYNRYTKLNRNGEIKKMPHIVLSVKSSDYYITYHKNSTRLDNVSYDAYGDANFDWLILLANQNICSLEYEIPDGTELRIPYPLDETLKEYATRIDNYDNLYGID